MARKALKCEHRYEMRAKNMILAMRAKPWHVKIIMKCVLKINISHAREASKANIVIESEVKTQIRYTSKSPEGKHRYRIRCENASSLYHQSAEGG